MQTLGNSMDELLDKFLVSPDKNWQPTDMLPNSNSPDFLEEVKELQELAMEIDYDLFAVLIGDTITEEALPTYQSWLMGLDGVDQGTPVDAKHIVHISLTEGMDAAWPFGVSILEPIFKVFKQKYNK